MDNFLIIQIYMLFLFMFAIHVYFLFNKLFVNKRKISLNDSNILWIFLGLVIIVIIFGFFYNEFLINDNLKNINIKDSIANWGAFGSYFGGFVAPILTFITFITLIILIKQISISREANNLQIEHLNKTRRIEILINHINSLSNKLELAIEKPYELTKELVEIFLKNQNQNNLFIKTFVNNYRKKISIVCYTDEKTRDEFEWKSCIIYLKSLYSKYEKDTKNYLDASLNIECYNISVLINKLIALCIELSNIDKNSYQIIKFTLVTFTETVEELRKIEFITNENYLHFHKLISIYNNSKASIEGDLKEIFKNELTQKYNININKNDLENIIFRIEGKENYTYSIEINDTTYLRINGNWINGKEILENK